MAGDPHVPRALNLLVGALLATLAFACAGGPRATPPDETGPPQAPPEPATSVRPARASPSGPDEATAAALDKAAWARLRWPAGTVVEQHRPERLDEPVHGGSIVKLVAARAAIERDPAVRDLRVVCPRRVETHGRRVDCVHADPGRPLSLEDALAHSCNSYFVRLAERIDPARFAMLLRQLSGGASPPAITAPLPLVVLGLDGPRLPMRTWLRVAYGAVAGDWGGSGRPAIPEGVARAVTEGSAAALADPAMLTFAKTGTTSPAGGQQEGVLVAWRPEIGEAIVVRVAGGAGRDAARIARAVWDRADTARQRLVRVGRVRPASSGRGDTPVSTPRVDVLPLESYVAGVVAAEGESGLPAASLEALAVLARSVGVAGRERHARDGFDVCDTTHCQVLGHATAWSEAATRASHGTVLSRAGRLVAAPYSASCGGTLVEPTDVWGGAGPVETAIGPDPGTHAIDVWTSHVTADALATVLRAAGHSGGQLRDVRVLATTRGGMPARIALDGLHPAEIGATTFRHLVGRRLGWDVLKSHVWQVRRTAHGYRFDGRGKGHGAGLCVRGAAVLASRGASADGVLRAYVPGADIVSLDDDVRVRVPAVFTAHAAELRRSIRTTLAALRVQLLVHGPREMDVTVHPTREAYQRATGRAWWTSASTREVAAGRYRIDVAPPAGAPWLAALQPTLRHELVHVLTLPALAQAPAWVAEGLATLLARPDVGHDAGRAEGGETPRCPTDAQMRRPGGAAAMRAAYVEAARCVAAALSEGLGGWRGLAR